MHPTKPNQRCRIIAGRTEANDEGVSPNLGKVVTTVSKYAIMAGGTNPVWKVSGKGLITYYGAVGDTIDCLAIWLEVLPDEPEDKVEDKVEEIFSLEGHYTLEN